MRGRTGAVLVVGTGLVCLVLATSVQHRRAVAETSAATVPAQSAAIDWSAARRDAGVGAGGDARKLIEAITAANRDKIGRVSIPVLAPGDADLLQDLQLFPNGAFYSASSSSRGMGLLITGSGRVLAAAQGHSGAGGVDIERSESGIEAGFNRYGASYSVALDCRRPQDERCSRPAYLQGVVSRLVVLAAPGR